MAKSIYIFLLITLLLTNFSSALCTTANDAYLGQGDQHKEIILKTDCADCSFVNISSIKYPNGTEKITNYRMNQNQYSYNYSFTDTNDIGDYYYTTYGVNSLNDTCVQTVKFTISNLKPINGNSLIAYVIIWIFGYIFIFFLMIYITKAPITKLFGWLFMVINSLIGIYFLDTVLGFITLGITVLMLGFNLMNLSKIMVEN